MIFDHNHVFDEKNGVHQREFSEGEIVIGKHCWLGAGCIVLKDVHIGDHCVIGAGSVVTKDIPFGSIAVGSPAKVIRKIE
jgi:acetyltransferase-like isoleucine patch superfamily enzyme